MASTAADLAAAPLVAAHGVAFSYDRDPVLHGVDLHVGPGEFVALVGPNGSGKSTLLKVLLGVLAPAAGSVELFGSAPSRATARGRLGYVPQRPALASELPATVREIVTTGRLATGRWWRRPDGADRRAVEHAIESVGLAEKADSPLNELSGGQQQRTFIARAFACEPDLLILDEPIAGIDSAAQRRFRAALIHLIGEHGSGVLLVSHELSAVADDLDRVLVLRRTIVFDGPPEGLAAEGVSLGVHREDLPLWLEELG